MHDRLVVNTVALRQVSWRVLHFSPISIIPKVLHTHLHLQAALAIMINGLSLGGFR